MEKLDTKDTRYLEAEKKVKKIRNFYGFTFIYIIINLFVLYQNYRGLKSGESIWQLKYFVLPFFWGIGLVCYGMKTFFQDFILGSQWEEKKIKKLMEKEKQ